MAQKNQKTRGTVQKAKGTPVARRRYIWKEVQRRRILPLEDVRRMFPDVSNQLLKDDIKFLNELGIEISQVPDSADRRKINLIDSGARHTETKDPRSELARNFKELAARIVVGLICGLPPYLVPENGSEPHEIEEQARIAALVPSRLRDIATIVSIRNMLLAQTQQTNAYQILRRLEVFWTEMNRAVVIDAGTTNDRTIDRICGLQLPSRCTPLATLTICTNSRDAFHKLGDASVDAKVIMIGGEQVNRTDAVAGRLAELFLRTSGALSFGLAIIGTTLVNAKEMTIQSDSHEEASLKAIMFQKSSIRVCVFDHTKINYDPVRSSYPVVAIDPQQIDILVTSQIPDDVDDLAKNAFNKFIDSSRRLGVSVLIAKPGASLK